MKQNDTMKLLKKLIFILFFIPLFAYSQATLQWNGATDNDWGNGANWTNVDDSSTGAAPTATDNVIINTAMATVEISSTTAAYAKVLVVLDGTLTVKSGGSLIAYAAVGDIKYEVSVPDSLTHTMSSPVVGEVYDAAWIAANNVLTTTFNNGTHKVMPYNNNDLDVWDPYDGTAGTFGSGTGYGIGIDHTVTGIVTFEGEYADDDFTLAIAQGTVNNWNLLGNPYPSYLDIEAFIAENSESLADTDQAITVYGTAGYTTLTTGHLHPGQGFFVVAKEASGGSVSIKQSMQRPVAQFYRPNTTNPSITVTLSDGTSTKETQIKYLGGTTKGLDRGSDIGMFDGSPSNLRIFTHLLEENKGTAFGTQALPNSNLKSMVVPLGVKATAGEKITFSVEALNLPSNLKVFLEDKITNTFTRLDEANTNYTVTLSEGLDGIGRFYIHTSKRALTVDDPTLNTVHIYKSDISTLRIVGLPQGGKTIKLFNVLGKQVLDTSFEDDAKDISLPKLETGVYIVDVQTEIGKLNKKIILE